MGMFENRTDFEIGSTAAGRALLAVALGCALWATPAAAAAVAARTFVSSLGNDSNPCTISAPCRSLQAAVNVTAPAGEVVILTPGGYGTVTISQAITIANDGVGTASISVPANGNGITINAGSTDSVQLRGLEIDGNNAGGNYGIVANFVGSLSVVNCVVRHTAVGVYLVAGTTNVFNSVISDQGPADPSNPDNYYATGIQVLQATVYVTSSLLSGNSNDAILAQKSGAAYVDHDTITGNGVGLMSTSGGKIYSFQDNNVSGNTTANTSDTVTPASPQ